MGGRHRTWASGYWAFAAALALFCVGCGEDEGSLRWGNAPPAGASGSAGSGAPAEVMPSIEGTWAIVAGDMDATVVELAADGSGWGCQAGWPDDTALDPEYATSFCGPVTGWVEDHQVAFELALTGSGEPLTYGMLGTLSADGDRIGGIHRISFGEWISLQRGSAVRYDPAANPEGYPLGPAWPQEAREIWSGTLTATTDTRQGPFAPGEEYELRHAFNTVNGDLGEFLGSELSFETEGPGNLTVHAGPVEKTRGDRPLRLAIHFAAGKPADVEVEMPSGETFVLAARF